MSQVCDRIFECPGWEKSYKQIINGQIYLDSVKNIKYTGDKFKYCPWCGKEITWEIEGEK